MIIKLDAEKAFKNTSLHGEIRDTRKIPNIIKAVYIKPTINIKLNEEKLKAIALKSGTRQGCPLSPYID